MLLMSMFLVKVNGGALALQGFAADNLQLGDQPHTMTASESAHTPAKISAEFAARLERLAPDEPIRVIVLADGARPAAAEHDEPDPRARRRELAADARRAATEDAMAAVDDALAATTGRRLTDRPNALGHIVVETTRSGIESLCRLACVRAILEDQAIHPHLPVARPE